MTAFPTRVAPLLVILLAPSAQAETLTLDQCVAAALKNSPDMATANLEIDAAQAKKASARGGYSPRLRLDASIQRWDKALGAPLFGRLRQYVHHAPELRDGIDIGNLAAPAQESRRDDRRNGSPDVGNG